MLLGLFAAAAAEPAAGEVLVPEATPATLSDFAVAYMVYDMVVTELRDAGVSTADAEDITSWAGGDADACFDNDGCPANLWGRTAARVAVVLSVGQGTGGLEVEARLYTRDKATPVKILSEKVPEGAEEAYAKRLATAVGSLVASLSLPADDEDLPDPEPPPRSGSGDRYGTLDEEPKTEPKSTAKTEPKSTAKTEPKSTAKTEPKSEPKSTAKTEPKSEPKSTAKTAPKANDEAPLTAKQQAEMRQMGIPAGAYRRYLASGQAADAWLAEARVRTGRVHAEVKAGVGIGDVNRGYATWVLLENVGGRAEVSSSSTWLGDGAGAGAYAGAAAGFTPFWFLDLGLAAGIQQGSKYLESGWECPACNPDTQLVVTNYEPSLASQLLLEPYVRAWVLPTGLAKPYAQLGFQLRAFDGFDVPGETIAWTDAPGGVGTGLTLGAGVALDVTETLSIQVEVPYTLHLAPAASATDSPEIGSEPTSLDPFGGVLRLGVAAGMVF